MSYLLNILLALFGFFMLDSTSQVVISDPAKIQKVIRVATNEEVYNALPALKPGDTLLLAEGNYKDIQLVLSGSGKEGEAIVVRAENPGKVFFTGDVKVELRGDHIILEGIFFKNGARNPEKWSSHGPGLVAIYGSYNRVTQCAFDAFDDANSAYITTSLTEDGKVPQYCRIDHCSFTNKVTFDQVINLNNTFKTTKTGPGGPPMYHRIDHCFFSNPKKPGNAGGGIRIGYYRNDTGRCVVDSNLFMRQDSEPEIITSKSRENIYYANTFLNCQGTLNFRHGDQQVAINNFFMATDTNFEYGGMFVWGSGHLIANNYFDLQRTISSRGNAALYLNPGAEASEHAGAFDILIINNLFRDINGYAINFRPLEERRRQYAKINGLVFKPVHHITLEGNIFYTAKPSDFPFFKMDESVPAHHLWQNNVASGQLPGMALPPGLKLMSFSLLKKQKSFVPQLSIDHTISVMEKVINIPGVSMNLTGLVNKGITGKPLTINEVGPVWLRSLPGNYALTGKLNPELQRRLDKVTKKR